MKNLQSFFIREETIKAVRHFFDARKFHEVITPSMNIGLPLEPNIHAFETHWVPAGEKIPLYLSTSPESGLKKMIAAGIGNCYAIGKCFRNLEGAGNRHNPEFLMLEWYREDARYPQIMDDTRELVRSVKQRVDRLLQQKESTVLHFQGKEIELGGEWPVYSMEELFRTRAGIEIAEVLEDEALFEVAKKKGYHTEGATWSQVFDQIFLNEVEVHFTEQPFFLIDFPAKLSPLCTTKTDKPYLAERFEFFIAGMEIGNGNNEQTDAEKVRKYSMAEQERRQSANLFAPPIDEAFLVALQTMNQKQYAGIGLGIDRLAMLMADTMNIADVEFFSTQYGKKN